MPENEVDESKYLPEYRLRCYSDDDLSSYNLTFPVNVSPMISVVIPIFNQLRHTLNCLESIKRHLPKASIEILVVDDCSSDRSEEVLSKIHGIKYIKNPENLKFLRSCNRAVDYAEGEYIFLLNNDTVVTNGWLDELLLVHEKKADAGLVGSKLIYPDGRLQEAGGIVFSDASGWNYGREDNPSRPQYNYLKEVDYVSGAAILFARQLFLDLGKFDEHFAPAYYEETDLAFQIRKHGKKVYFQPESIVIHYEGVSNGTNLDAGVKKHQVKNKVKFLEKWKNQLDAEHLPGSEHLFRARDRSSRKKALIMLVDDSISLSDESFDLESIMNKLVYEGLQVKCVIDPAKITDKKNRFQRKGVEVISFDEWQQYRLHCEFGRCELSDFDWIIFVGGKGFVQTILESSAKKVSYLGTSEDYKKIEKILSGKIKALRFYELNKKGLKSLVDSV